MIITKQQATLIAELANQIKEKYGFLIGYFNPAIPLPAQLNADFIIYESPEEEDFHCFYKDDIEEQEMGSYIATMLPIEPEHDEQVQKLLDRVNSDLLEGNLWFEPTISRTVDGLEIEVTKKKVPSSDEEVFATNIETNKFSMVYTYDFISNAAKYDQRFKIAKSIIDEHWPRKSTDLTKSKKIKSKESIISTLLKFFGI